MVEFKHFENFYFDKQGFFSRIKTVDSAFERANDTAHNYRFIAQNRLLIEQEFDQLFSTLQKNGKDRDEFWLYCYYCCVLLQRYYFAYGKKEQIEKYKKLKEDIAHRIETGMLPVEADQEPFLTSFKKKLMVDLGVLATTPMRTTKIRDWLAFFNIYRIHFVFSRLAVKQSLLLMRELHLFEILDRLLGHHTDVDGMIAIINAPAAVFNALSVGLFAARFILNTGVIMKHLLMPSYSEEKYFSATERFSQAFASRYCVMLNDLVWGVANGLTNYAAFFHLSAPVAGWLTAGFLLFDISLLVYRRHLAEQEYRLKESQYEYEIAEYKRRLGAGMTDIEEKHDIMLHEQLKALRITWEAESATYFFNIAAAVLLMAGFSASMILAPAIWTAAVCYIICTIAVSMYINADLFGAYRKKSLILRDAQDDPKASSEYVAKALLEAKSARNDFIMGMIKTTVMPLLIVTTFAISIPAALILVAVYIAYECTHRYFKQPSAAEDEPEEEAMLPRLRTA